MSANSHRFLCDLMLGKLAVYLRMCGYDTAYAGDLGIEADSTLRRISREEGRTLLSRDRALTAATTRSMLIQGHAVETQLTELRSAGIELEIADPPVRCGRCNGILHDAPPKQARPEYAPDNLEIACYRCTDCGQYFWRGSHWDAVQAVL